MDRKIKPNHNAMLGRVSQSEADPFDRLPAGQSTFVSPQDLQPRTAVAQSAGQQAKAEAQVPSAGEIPFEPARRDKPPVATISDVCAGLRREGIAGVLAYDEFANELVVTTTNRWHLPVGEISDEHVNTIAMLVEQQNFSVTAKTVYQAIATMATKNRIHLVRDRLSGLKWKQKKLIDTWLPDALGLAADSGEYGYLSAIGTKWLLGAVARVLNTSPDGVALPATLVFSSVHSVQNVLEALAVLGGSAFSDSMGLGSLTRAKPLQDPAWIVALQDFADFVVKEPLRGFLAARTDVYRAAHDSRARKYARGFVPVGVTRDTEYLKLGEGLHLWPVNLGDDGFNVEWLRKNRGQLLAEAVHRYRQGERLDFDPVKERTIIDQIEAQRSERQFVDLFEEIITRYLMNINRNYKPDQPRTGWVRMANILEACNVPPAERLKSGPGTPAHRAGRILRRLGWVNLKGKTYREEGFGGVVWVNTKWEM
jgi:putative DNA primase/helicase